MDSAEFERQLKILISGNVPSDEFLKYIDSNEEAKARVNVEIERAVSHLRALVPMLNAIKMED